MDASTFRIKYCPQITDVLHVDNTGKQMIRSILRAGAVLAVACMGMMAQTQPPPIIIAPPATAEPGSAAASPADSAKGAAPQGAAPQGTAPQGTTGKGSKGKNSAPIPGADPAGASSAYVIGPEDVLFVRVWQQPELSGSVSVGPDGTISLQLIGEVKAAGLTARQLEVELTKRFKAGFLQEPEVNVQLLRNNSRTYMIQGDGVIRPGIYPLTRPLTVLEALLAGGGFTPFANKKKIYILRGTEKIKFNWAEVTKGKNLAQNIKIQNGDQIYVP
jgi:polysaccharide export outer membrane protein